MKTGKQLLPLRSRGFTGGTCLGGYSVTMQASVLSGDAAG